MKLKELKQEHILTEYKCNHCGHKLWFDGRGCYCDNRDCIVYNGYVLKLNKI